MYYNDNTNRGEHMYRLGIDIGSTTIKAVVIDMKDKIIYKDYLRHQSDITTSLRELLSHINGTFSDEPMYVNFTGSASF